MEALRRLGVRHRLVALTNAGQGSTGATPAAAAITTPDLHFTTLADLADALDAR